MLATPIIYHITNMERLKKKYQPGQKIMVTEVREDGEETAAMRRKQYTVVKAFPYHLSCIDRNGMRRSFGYFELENIVI